TCSATPPILPSFPTRRSSDLNLDYALWPPAGMKRKGKLLPPATLGPPTPLARSADDDLGLEDDEAEEEAPATPAAKVEGEEEGRSEEHTSELQSQSNLVCRLL